MCGIFAVLSHINGAQAPSLFGLLDKIKKVIKFDLDSEASKEALEQMETLQKESHLWIRPEGFLAVYGDPTAANEMKEAAGMVEAWLERIEHQLQTRKDLSQETREQVNRLVVGGRDVTWRLKKDLLENIPKVRALLPESELHPLKPWGHVWAINLVLNNIDRLEVRGRDSAGLGVFVRFSSQEDKLKFLDQKDLGARIDSERSSFSHLACVNPKDAPDTLLFAFKVAQEVGEMGENVSFLRKAIAEDKVFQAALTHPGISIQVMGHTRWASNGVISLPNCHPVDSAVLKNNRVLSESNGAILAALNGDIDNYQELIQKYVKDKGYELDQTITTDAKIIPIVVQAHLQDSKNLEEAFAKAFDEFKGSMAICLMAADRPGEFICAQKGSGQGLFVGLAGETVAVASEMYGLVELTADYIKAEGERSENGKLAGETFLVDASADKMVKHLPEGEPIDPDRIHQAEITTRDINRGEYPRFLLKEITESLLSVKNTIRGKVFFDEDGKDAHTLLDETVLPKKVIEGFKGGRIKRIIPTGQGTAAVAAQGIGHLLSASLADVDVAVLPMKATELSGHYLTDDMSDCLIVAVSQSGTTTDTNRTVDLARDRGASIVAIVNRRNSDLVYKSDGVLYTSDGRDIEMSVASTKAFYAQNVAGQILALALAEALNLLSKEQRLEKLKALVELPDAMKKVLELSPKIEEIAEKTALKHRYWAIVGTGASKIAADEIRIKLSELCYKAIAVDYLEDKKHIDLSSEPMIIVCASGLPPSSVSDVVKEVAIFKAHSSVPIVIADEDEKRFDPYAAHLAAVPCYTGELGYLLPTMVGHLYGYYAATAFDRKGAKLKELRYGLVQEIEAGNGELEGTELWKLLGRSPNLTSVALEVQEIIQDGEVDSGLEVGTASKLSSLIDFFLGRISLNHFTYRFKKAGTVGRLLAALVEQLSEAINELGRPIDAIKHQAKTVTVGISREETRPMEGVLWSVLSDFSLDPEDMTAGPGNVISALSPIVEKVEGASLYRVRGLTPIGKPLFTSTIQMEKRTGCAEEIDTRCDAPVRLSGTKWGVVADQKVFLGIGHSDQRKILIVPILGQGSAGHLLLMHIVFKEKGPREQRLAALKSLQDRYKQILIAVTEITGEEWDPAAVDQVNNDQLFLLSPRELAQLLK